MHQIIAIWKANWNTLQHKIFKLTVMSLLGKLFLLFPILAEVIISYNRGNALLNTFQ